MKVRYFGLILCSLFIAHVSGCTESKEKDSEKSKSQVAQKTPDRQPNRNIPNRDPRNPQPQTNRLAIGMTVPEIEGEDIDGKVFRLSDYRGKVVVLDFWGDW